MENALYLPKLCGKSLSSEETEKIIEQGLWNHHAIHLDKAHKLSRGEGVNIAVLDSGVDYTHPELQCSFSGSKVVVDGCKDVDEEGHGTFVTGVIAGKRTGVAPLSNIYSVKIYSKGEGEVDDLKDAIFWCLSNNDGVKIDLINISMGSPSYLPDLADVCQLAYEKNVPIVASAGNNYSGAFFPASHKEVISVASVREVNDSLEYCESSNLWSTTNLAAPGEAIVSVELGGGYCTGGGTSAAAPHVTGVIALGISLLKKKGELVEIKKLEKILEETTVELKHFEKAEELSARYDPDKILLVSSEVTLRYMFGSGLVQADEFVVRL